MAESLCRVLCSVLILGWKSVIGLNLLREFISVMVRDNGFGAGNTAYVGGISSNPLTYKMLTTQ